MLGFYRLFFCLPSRLVNMHSQVAPVAAHLIVVSPILALRVAVFTATMER
jgi:hypothetical protein